MENWWNKVNRCSKKLISHIPKDLLQNMSYILTTAPIRNKQCLHTHTQWCFKVYEPFIIFSTLKKYDLKCEVLKLGKENPITQMR